MPSARQALAAVCLLVAAPLAMLIAFQDGPATSAIAPDGRDAEVAAENHDFLPYPSAPPSRDGIELLIQSSEPDTPPVERSLASESVLFSVSDTDGEPMAEAVLTVSGPGTPVEYLTDADGLVELPTAAVRNALVSATRPGRSVEFVHPSEHPHATYRLTLKHSATISGRLVMADEEPVPDGVHVCAFRQLRMDLDDRDLPRMARLGRGCSIPVEADGSFCIRGLEAGGMYRVCGYGGGVALDYREQLTQCTAPADSIELVGYYVGAVDFELEASSAGLTELLTLFRYPLPDLHREAGAEPEFLWRVRWHGEQQQRFSTLLSLRLAGLTSQTRYGDVGFPMRVFVKAKTRSAAAANGTLEWDTPFSERVEIMFKTAFTQDASDIPVATLPLPTVPITWTPEGMGSLEIAFHAPWLQEGSPSSVLQARVRLRPMSSPHGESLTVAAAWDRDAAGGAGAFLIPEVPEGSYEAWLFEASTGASFPFRKDPGWIVEIERGQRNQIDATDCEVAAVLLELFEVNGEPFERGLSVDLMLKYPGHVGHSCMASQTPAFTSAPYLFPFLPVDRTRDKEGLFAHLHNAFVYPRPVLIEAEELRPGELHRVQVTVRDLPRSPEEWSALAR